MNLTIDFAPFYNPDYLGLNVLVEGMHPDIPEVRWEFAIPKARFRTLNMQTGEYDWHPMRPDDLTRELQTIAERLCLQYTRELGTYWDNRDMGWVLSTQDWWFRKPPIAEPLAAPARRGASNLFRALYNNDWGAAQADFRYNNPLNEARPPQQEPEEDEPRG